jgi:hypothetical protein
LSLTLRSFAIRHLIAFAVVLSLAATNVQADLVSYTMTGTIQNVSVMPPAMDAIIPANASAPVGVGDHISWTLSFDRATPLLQSLSIMYTNNISNLYGPSGPSITNLVDLTRGTQLYTAPPGSIHAVNSLPTSSQNPYTSLRLFNGAIGGVEFMDNQPSTQNGALAYSTQLNLTSKGPLPTTNLAKLQLDTVPFRFNDNSLPAPFQFTYNGQLNANTMFTFSAQLNSLSASASIQSVPEPATLTLFALGLVGVVVRRFRCPL